MAKMGEGAVGIFPAAPERIRNNDAHYPYRQDSDLHWLTGFDEPQSVLFLRPGAKEQVVLFVQARDPAKEQWEGKRAGVEGAVADHGADVAYEIDRLDELGPQLLDGAHTVVYRLGVDPAWDARLVEWLKRLRAREKAGVVAPAAIVDVAPLLHEARLRKDEDELATMRRAGSIASEAHAAAMKAARAGMREYELQAVIEGIFRSRGGSGPAYQTIVAAGRNATILHYRAGAEELRPGELCLVDAGCEYESYASDISRTFPVDGRFTPAQQRCYELVLAAQEAAIATVAPGKTIDDVHRAAVRVLTQGMIDLGLLEGSVDEAIESGAFRRYYMHGTSHWLGMDVHDVGAYRVGGVHRPLEPGMVLTVEPGLYIGDDAPEAFRGIGIRIEDDVAVREGGCEVLTDAPKTVREVEAACR